MNSSESNRLYALVTAGLLMTRKEYRLAIPYCEQAIQLLSEQDEPLALADMLWRAGYCYASACETTQPFPCEPP